MFVRVRACVRACVCACLHACMHACIRVCVCVCVCARARARYQSKHRTNQMALLTSGPWPGRVFVSFGAYCVGRAFFLMIAPLHRLKQNTPKLWDADALIIISCKHAGSDPEACWLRPVVAITTSVQPELAGSYMPDPISRI